MVKKKKHKYGEMEGGSGEGGVGNPNTAEQITPEEIKQFLPNAQKLEVQIG